MADWSWKQAVALRVLRIVNAKASPEFALHELYEYENEFKAIFPRNTRIRQKIRQVLQRLRDDESFVLFEGEGNYTLNLQYEELDTEAVLPDEKGIVSPATKTVLKNIRLRNTFLAREMKHRYRNTCQVCRVPLPISETDCYAESHHLRPLGSPHNGPDSPGNIIVLCPNHHVLFDRAAVTLDPPTLTVVHRCAGLLSATLRLYLEPWHKLDDCCLQYHHRRFEELRR